MSREYKFLDKDQLYFVSFSVVDWIDLFIRNEYKNILIRSWEHCIRHKGMELYGYCIMTSHVHMIIGSQQKSLEDIMRDMKRHTSLQLKDAIRNHPSESRKDLILCMMEKAGKKNCNNSNFQLWQQDNHPIQLKNLKMAHQKLDYTHYNPVEAGFVSKPEDYLYSSARNYLGMKGLIDVIILDPLMM